MNLEFLPCLVCRYFDVLQLISHGQQLISIPGPNNLLESLNCYSDSGKQSAHIKPPQVCFEITIPLLEFTVISDA